MISLHLAGKITMETRYFPVDPTENMVEAAYPLLNSMPQTSPERCKRVIRAIYGAMIDQAPPRPSTGLLRREAKVQEFIHQYIETEKQSPTFDEISKGTGLYSRSDAFAVVQSLIRKGVVQKNIKRKHRSLDLIVRPGEQISTAKRKK